MINLKIDFRTCQKYRILMSARQRPNRWFRAFKRKCFGEYDAVTLTLFFIWLHEILKLIFQKQPSCPRNICTEHWRKPPIFTAFLEIFLYLKLKDNDSVEYLQKVLSIALFIYFEGKISFLITSGRSSCFELLFWFSSAILLFKIKSLFFSM